MVRAGMAWVGGRGKPFGMSYGPGAVGDVLGKAGPGTGYGPAEGAAP